MIRKVILDTSPLGKLCNPNAKPDILLWQASLTAAGWELIVPEIADYEVRRNLLAEGKTSSILILEEFKQSMVYQPITSRIGILLVHPAIPGNNRFAGKSVIAASGSRGFRT